MLKAPKVRPHVRDSEVAAHDTPELIAPTVTAKGAGASTAGAHSCGVCTNSELMMWDKVAVVLTCSKLNTLHALVHS